MVQGGVQLPWEFGALEALQRWPVERRAVLLHSGRFHRRWARWSILSEPLGTFRFSGAGSHWIGPSALRPAIQFTHRPMTDLRAALGATQGLWIGHVSYDLGRWVETLPSVTVDDRDWPLVDLGWCPGYLVHDGLTNTWRALGRWESGGFPDLASAAPKQATFTASRSRSTFTRRGYERSVARVLNYIAAGDVFQVNLAQRFTMTFEGPAPLATRSLFDRLATASPAWYGAYLETVGDDGGSGRAIASTSPELFLEVDDHGRVITRPIKGTRPASVEVDELRHSEKDKAELAMIVDLMRNDLGRVCDYGSVRVPQARVIESHPTVHHGVATIEGRLHASKDVMDLLRATVPGGSVTGAPKIRAMQIIDELEPVRRGPYCGCIGYLSARTACLNIAIRTLLIDPAAQRLDYSVGGGIVADSEPALEYEETIHKAAAMRAALGAASQRARTSGRAGARHDVESRTPTPRS